MIPPPRALVLSPSPSHPQDYGNRNRVWQITSFLKQLGYSIDFLLYPVEAEWNEIIPPQTKDMQSAWDSFWIIPPSTGNRFHCPAQGEYHEADEWWDDAIGNHLKWLFAHRAYDLFVVNYTFLSKAFTFAPNTTTKILDTHDLFTGRKELLAKLGVEPEFFYTTQDQERIALDRADIVIAIKESEAETLRGWTNAEVVSIPFFPEARKRPPARETDSFKGLSVGFVGAGNSINTVNLKMFLRVFDPLLRVYCPPLRFLIAGNVCHLLRVDNPAVELLGRVPNLDDFYSQVDVIVAPLEQSTGIKIKVGEALAYGKGVVSTPNGYDGFPALDSMHGLRSMTEVSTALIQLAFDPTRLKRLEEQSRLSAKLASRATDVALDELAEKVRNRSLRIVMITDCPFWARGGARASRLNQWAQFCGFLTRTVNFYLAVPGANLAGENFEPLPDILQMEIPGLESGAFDPVELAERLDAQLQALGICQIMISVNASWAGSLASELVALGHAPMLDLWCPALRAAVRQARGVNCDYADFWFVEPAAGGLDKGELIEATALRWLPHELAAWKGSPQSDRILLVSSAGEPFGNENDLRLAAAARGLRLSILSDGSPLDGTEVIYEAFRRETDKPALLVAASTDTRIQSLCASLAFLAGVPFVLLEPQGFPRAVATRRGQVKLCESAGEFLAEVVRSDGDRVCFCTHNADIGWSRLWKILERRIRMSQLEQPFELKTPDTKIRGRRQGGSASRATTSRTRPTEMATQDGAIS